MRLSIGGADARHFHAISTGPPGASPVTTAGDTGTAAMGTAVMATGTRRGTGVSAGDGDSGAAGVTKRVFRVHTGGRFASGVSFPVPHGGGSALGRFGAGRPGERGVGDACLR